MQSLPIKLGLMDEWGKHLKFIPDRTTDVTDQFIDLPKRYG